MGMDFSKRNIKVFMDGSPFFLTYTAWLLFHDPNSRHRIRTVRYLGTMKATMKVTRATRVTPKIARRRDAHRDAERGRRRGRVVGPCADDRPAGGVFGDARR